MIVNNGIGIELLIDNKDADIQPTFLSFTYVESIHNLLPKLIISYPDNLGLAQELLTFCEGRNFTLKLQDTRFDDKEEIKSFNMTVVKEDRVYNNSTMSFLSTDNKVTSYHQFYNNDEEKSLAYNNTTSNIIQDILDNYLDYRFKNTNIYNSADKKIYYQPLKNDIDFIENILLKNCYHFDETPYFCFIDSFDTFNYITYKKMLSSSVVAEITDTPKNRIGLNRDSILSYEILSVGSEVLKSFRGKDYYIYNKFGNYDNENITLLTFNPFDKKILPIVKTSDKTSHYYLGNIDFNDEEAYNIKGKMIQESKNSFFVERLLITTNYNVKYSAGKKVKLSLHLSDGNGIKDSKYYNGEYIIEANYIIWDNKNKLLNNRLLLSKCDFNIDDNIMIKNKLIQE